MWLTEDSEIETRSFLMYVCLCVIYENDERYQLDANIVTYYHKYLYMFRASIYRKLLLICIFLLSQSLVFFRFIFYQYMVVFRFNIVIYVFLL